MNHSCGTIDADNKQNKIPPKEIVKVSFTLEPYNKELPYVTAHEGYVRVFSMICLITDRLTLHSTERLNANRMLRARKILGYVADRLEKDQDGLPVPVNPDGLKPEEYLELYCQDKVSRRVLLLLSSFPCPFFPIPFTAPWVLFGCKD